MLYEDPTAIMYSEVEFDDMEHTLDWLLETAQKYHCETAISHIQTAKVLIMQTKVDMLSQVGNLLAPI